MLPLRGVICTGVSARALMIDSGVTQAMDNLTKDADLPHKVSSIESSVLPRPLYVCSVDLRKEIT